VASGFEDEDDDQSENDKEKQKNTAPPPSIFLVSEYLQKREKGLMIRTT
jgi:hypothetical protein